jgi:predicted ABC-type ATPase
LAPWLRHQIETGYALRLFYLWLPSADLAVQRVQGRVREGGHHVPEETIRRRYPRGLANLFELYIPLAASWEMLDGSSSELRPIAAGGLGMPTEVLCSEAWQRATAASRDPEKGT